MDPPSANNAPPALSTLPRIRAERPASKVNPARLDALLADPTRAPSWSVWISKVEPASDDIWHVETSDGVFLLAWWYRPEFHQLVLRFKYGYFAADAHYRLSLGPDGEPGGARLEADVPAPPPGWATEPGRIRQRLGQELDALARAAT